MKSGTSELIAEVDDKIYVTPGFSFGFFEFFSGLPYTAKDTCWKQAS